MQDIEETYSYPSRAGVRGWAIMMMISMDNKYPFLTTLGSGLGCQSFKIIYLLLNEYNLETEQVISYNYMYTRESSSETRFRFFKSLTTYTSTQTV